MKIFFTKLYQVFKILHIPTYLGIRLIKDKKDIFLNRHVQDYMIKHFTIMLSALCLPGGYLYYSGLYIFICHAYFWRAPPLYTVFQYETS